MLYQKNNYRRPSRGSVTPFIVMSAFLFLVTMGFCIDLMRDFESASQLNFAAQSAVLYALSLATNSNGSYSTQC